MIDIACFDGTYSFRLGLAQIVALETKCGPIGEVYSRILKGRYQGGFGEFAQAAFAHADLVETIRQGLLGGGKGVVDGLAIKVDSLKCAELMTAYIGEMPIREKWDLATAIMGVAMEGYEPIDDDQKKSGDDNEVTESQSELIGE